ncbi:hypothetical protein MVES_002824 [Malassezia vespertilionis]|uniref:GTP cyclohydrolase 1 n=1 Tax=Malassezia vespertilionis TaxID=2020962 RepID=A0A2N1J9M4_9BASI|nr:hypothetical protein MVES_002824 [Malassezia vespertilionis]
MVASTVNVHGTKQSVDDSELSDAYDSDVPDLYGSRLSASQLEMGQRGGGLGTPTGAVTSASGAKGTQESVTAVLDKNGLGWPAKSTLSRLNQTPEEAKQNELRLADAVTTILECLGEDPDRPGLRDTPQRYARALLWMTKGYEEQLCGKVRSNFAMYADDAQIHIGYIPDRMVIGLSKLARIAETFARRLSVQERLTRQVALALDEALKPRGVAVVMEAEHMCMAMRGVQKPGASTVTSCMLGVFRNRAKTREEFLSLIRH